MPLAALLSVEGTVLSDREKRLFAHDKPLGVTLFNRNLENVTQLKKLITELKEVINGEDTIIAVDSEGGRVNRLKAAGFADYAFQKTLAQTSAPEKAVQLHAKLIARDMLSVGVNFNFAPVLDVEQPQTSKVLQGRIFSADEKQVATLSKIMIQTYQELGICPCMKHLPGHGRAVTDPHLGLPIIEASRIELERDFYPFRVCSACPAGMTAHILLKAIDDKNPISCSSKGIQQIIRQEIGFQGLLISDAIDMKALKGDVVTKSVACWNAGCDVVCYCMGKFDEMESLCQKGRPLSDEGLSRFENIKKVWHNKSANMLDLNEKEYYSMVQQVASVEVDYDATETLNQMQKGVK